MAEPSEMLNSLNKEENDTTFQLGKVDRLVAANALKTLSSELSQSPTDECDSKSDVDTQKDELLVTEKDANFSRTFPEKLMEIISDDNNSSCISWLPDGHAFSISNRKKLSKDVIPRYFKGSSKYTSFTRKLNRWGFTCFTRGVGICIFHHKMFHRDFPHLCMKMICKKSSKIVRCKDDKIKPSIKNKNLATSQDLFSLPMSKPQQLNFEKLAADVGNLHMHKTLISTNSMSLPNSHFSIDDLANSKLATHVNPNSHKFDYLPSIARAACNHSLIPDAMGQGYNWILQTELAALRRQSYQDSLRQQQTLMLANAQIQSMYTDHNSLPTMYNPSSKIVFPPKAFQAHAQDYFLTPFVLSNQAQIHDTNGFSKTNNDLKEINKKPSLEQAQKLQNLDKETSSTQKNFSRSTRNAYAA